MFKKISYSPDGVLDTVSSDSIKASPKLVERMTKLAKSIKSVAPKSDDFLYFSIIFLKSAESALLDNDAGIKKLASGEAAWGYFDENWKWHGNVKPHKNNNGDIFPESELKKAAKDWIGLPLCRDHESSSVEGIRGIILDTHYDEKYKQVVGLCALDKVSYPELARMVQNGLVRYGSMGTAVETSVCTTCGNKARTQSEYCEHVLGKTAHGEINVGLKPIEYSLVVQPAEPGAVLLRCIASLKEYKEELVNHGVENVDKMLGKLSLKQAQHLEGIMKTACGPDGCSIEKRSNIISSFLKNSGLASGDCGCNTKQASSDIDTLRNTTQSLKDIEELRGTRIDINNPGLLDELAKKVSKEVSVVDGEGFSSGESRGERGDRSNPADTPVFSGDGPWPPIAGVQDAPDYQGDDLLTKSEPVIGDEPMASYAANNSGDVNRQVGSLSINSIMEDIMNESRLRKRAEMRRRVAYHQGGSDGVEPNTFKHEDSSSIRDNQDKQMQQAGNMGGDSGLYPGDAETKQKLSRAQIKERMMRRMAYHQGGSEGVEPNTYRSEDYKSYRDSQDKQMQQTGNMGGDSGLYPGDAEAKQKLSRAAYNGPALRTRFSLKRRANGSVDHANSVFEVFSGNKRVIASTAGQIFGSELRDNWNWLISREYGQEVCKHIRAYGLNSVGKLLKNAQEMPPPPEGDMGMEMPPPPADMPDLGAPEPLPEEAPEEEESASDAIDGRLAEMEELISEVRDLVGQLEDEKMADVNVAVNVGGEDEEGGTGDEVVALSSKMVGELKVALAELDESADELAMVAETYDNINRLSRRQRSEFSKLAKSAISDSSDLTVETKTLVRVAKKLAGPMIKAAMDLPAMDKMDHAMDRGMDLPEGDMVSDSMIDAIMSDDAMDSGLDLPSNPARDDAYATMADDMRDDMALPAHDDMALPADDDMALPADDDMRDMVSEAMDMRRRRRESILKNATARENSDRRQRRERLLESQPVSEAKAGDTPVKTASKKSAIKEKLQHSFETKRVSEEREAYRTRLRRAYDVGLEMQKKGLLALSKSALDKQVDEIMAFDDRAFEAFKRSIGNARALSNTKIASDLGGLNVGVSSDNSKQTMSDAQATVNVLAGLWD